MCYMTGYISKTIILAEELLIHTHRYRRRERGRGSSFMFLLSLSSIVIDLPGAHDVCRRQMVCPASWAYVPSLQEKHVPEASSYEPAAQFAAPVVSRSASATAAMKSLLATVSGIFLFNLQLPFFPAGSLYTSESYAVKAVRRAEGVRSRFFW